MNEYNNNFEREFGWEDEIVKDSTFVILEPGEYWFTVKSIERQRHTPNGQSQSKNPLPACNKAVVTLTIIDNQGNEKNITHNLFLHSRTEGMLSAFFGAIGHKKHGEPLKMNWNAAIGQVGVCSIKKNVSNKGNEFNEVGYMIYQDEVDTTKQLNANPKFSRQQPQSQIPYQQATSQQYSPQPNYNQPQQPNQGQSSWGGF
ncbi:hypothetical protein [Streptococcus equi]|uniref:hypothetical protein n=1 Tax=Streptococcus equi TaxID=1336 RepID=UPI000657B6D5|nr:hypothetical protein [Streptococcus equi]MCD3385612.1 hypothetical protein [Streptococcus equi subsp. zooepidemicus]MCD3394020.1 hypothetical protein [Streptococcus equi subsp. zooepidemicus]QTR96386.1 hypothetical protein HCFMJIKG_01632 [Streptococcus equi subsp. zooepidemicus]QTZ56418.1 hypothetical protein JFMEOBDD_00496 [Streptococcus equi subsp. zooepidemicus]WOK48386.1 hypothetical protein RIM73_04800 [Streptococcus equi subsp. equi]